MEEVISNHEIVASPSKNTLQSEEDIDEVELNQFINGVISVAKASLGNVVINVESDTDTTLPVKDNDLEDDNAASCKEGEVAGTDSNDEGSAFQEENSLECTTKDDDGELRIAEVNSDQIKKRKRFGWFKRVRRSSVVQPTDKSETKEHRVAFETQEPAFIFKSEHVDVHGNELFVLDTSKIPKTKNKESTIQLCLNVKQFVERELKTDTFAMVIHGGEGGSRDAELNSLQLGKQFYRIVKNSFAERLRYCFIHKAEFRLKALLKVFSPFMKRDVKRKFTLASSPRKLVFHGIPETILLD